MAQSDETLIWTDVTALDTGAQLVMVRADGQARIVLPYALTDGRRSYVSPGTPGGQPVFQTCVLGTWTTVEVLPRLVYTAWRRWCAHRPVIPRVDINIDITMPEPDLPGGTDHNTARLSRYQWGQEAEAWRDLDDDRLGASFPFGCAG